MKIVLYQPQIPPNTGNIARLCIAANLSLHLIHPLGFSIDDKSLKRAGLDYWSNLDVTNHIDWDSFLKSEFPDSTNLENLIVLSTKGDKPYWEAKFNSNSYLLFGNETSGLRGLDDNFEGLQKRGRVYTIPQNTEHVRSINLATSVGIVAYEGIRTLGGLPQSPLMKKSIPIRNVEDFPHA